MAYRLNKGAIEQAAEAIVDLMFENSCPLGEIEAAVEQCGVKISVTEEDIGPAPKYPTWRTSVDELKAYYREHDAWSAKLNAAQDELNGKTLKYRAMVAKHVARRAGIIVSRMTRQEIENRIGRMMG